MRRTSVVLGVLLLTLSLAGCIRKAKESAEPARVENQNPLNPVGGQPAQSDIRRGAEIQVNRNELSQVAKYYLNYELENGKPPATQAEFVAYLRADRNFPEKMITPLEKGHIVLVPNVKPTSNQVVAYEKHVFQKRNNRLVAFGDGRVEMMDDPAFQKIHPTADR
jgi:hypothetical protein